MILIVDNYDSFVHNLARYFRLLDCSVKVIRNDQVSLGELASKIAADEVQAVVMSPGPCSPDEAGLCLEIVKQFAHQVPMLGVCLGHQVIAQALGGKVVQWERPIHGKSELVYHDQTGEFENIPSPFPAARYHSLTVLENLLPSTLVVTARLADKTVMGLRHRQWPVIGYQFHPESILTECGLQLIEGFLRIANIPFRKATGQTQRQCEFPPGASRRDARLPGSPS